MNHLQIITYGKKHLIFWTQKKDGTFESTDLVPDDRSVTCLSFLESGDVIAGDDSGMIGVYSVNNQVQFNSPLKGCGCYFEWTTFEKSAENLNFGNYLLVTAFHNF